MKKKTIQNCPQYYDITKDIRNFQTLSENQLSFIETLASDEQHIIICLFNMCMKELMSRVDEFIRD